MIERRIKEWSVMPFTIEHSLYVPFTIEHSLYVDVKELKHHLQLNLRGVIFLGDYPGLKIVYDVETGNAKLEFKEHNRFYDVHEIVNEKLLSVVMELLKEAMDVVRQDHILESTLSLRNTGS
jgi:hypothetical protein